MKMTKDELLSKVTNTDNVRLHCSSISSYCLDSSFQKTEIVYVSEKRFDEILSRLNFTPSLWTHRDTIKYEVWSSEKIDYYIIIKKLSTKKLRKKKLVKIILK